MENFLFLDSTDEERKQKPKIIFLGDYIDCGPSSKEVIELLMNLKRECVFLAGNHEDLLLHFYKKSDFFNKYENIWFKGNGGQHTIASYTDSKEVLKKVFAYGNTYSSYPGINFLQEDFTFEKIYMEFFENLVYSHRETILSDHYKQNFGFLHAGLFEETESEEQLNLKTYVPDAFYYSREFRFIQIRSSGEHRTEEDVKTFNITLGS